MVDAAHLDTLAVMVTPGTAFERRLDPPATVDCPTVELRVEATASVSFGWRGERTTTSAHGAVSSSGSAESWRAELQTEAWVPAGSVDATLADLLDTAAGDARALGFFARIDATAGGGELGTSIDLEHPDGTAGAYALFSGSW